MENSLLCFCAFVKGKVDNLFPVKRVWQEIDQQGAFSPSVMSKSTCSTNAQQLCIDDTTWPWGLSSLTIGRDLIIRYGVPTEPFKVPHRASCCPRCHSFARIKYLFLWLLGRPMWPLPLTHHSTLAIKISLMAQVLPYLDYSHGCVWPLPQPDREHLERRD